VEVVFLEFVASPFLTWLPGFVFVLAGGLRRCGAASLGWHLLSCVFSFSLRFFVGLLFRFTLNSSSGLLCFSRVLFSGFMGILG